MEDNRLESDSARRHRGLVWAQTAARLPADHASARLRDEERQMRTIGLAAVLCLILALVALVPQARAQPLPPDQACSEIVKTLDRITGHRDSNQEAVRRGFIACRLFP